MKNSEKQAFGYGIPGDEKAGWLPENVEGLTKREYFAGLAMQGYCGGEFTGQSGMPHESIAKWSVEMANALLKQLEQ